MPRTSKQLGVSFKEDKVFSLLAEKRLKEKGKKLSHEEVWGNGV